MLAQPYNMQLSSLEYKLTIKLTAAMEDELQMVKQKLGTEYHFEGDRNTAFFHTALKINQAKVKITDITDMQGTLHTEAPNINRAFLDFFHHSMNDNNDTIDISLVPSLSLPRISNTEACNIITFVTDAEIKEALFSLNSTSTGGPDGFNTLFYKHTWEHIAPTFCKAIHHFFQNK